MLWFLFRPSSAEGQAQRITQLLLVLGELLWPTGHRWRTFPFRLLSRYSSSTTPKIISSGVSSGPRFFFWAVTGTEQVPVQEADVPCFGPLLGRGTVWCLQLVRAAFGCPAVALVHLPKENDVILCGQISCAVLQARLMGPSLQSLRERARGKQEQQCLEVPG